VPSERGNMSANPANTRLDPRSILIFGGSGDPTQRELVPALHSLWCESLLHPDTRVLGVARSRLADGMPREGLY